MSDTANAMADAFAGEAGTAPVINVTGVDASTVTTPSQVTSSNKFYTEDDLAKVRSQEKDKLYPQIEDLKTRLATFEKEREEAAARAAEEASSKEAAQRAKLEEDLDTKELLKLKEAEWSEQLAREREEREATFALWEREKTFADLQTYKQQLLEAERDNIMPQLLKYVQGNTREELDSAVADVKAQTADILDSTQSALQQQRRDQVGTRATLPPSGPLETNMEQRQLTPQEIASMPMNEYAKYREKIMSPSARGQNRGLLG